MLDITQRKERDMNLLFSSTWNRLISFPLIWTNLKKLEWPRYVHMLISLGRVITWP